jgi:serine/threonine protein kinase
MASDDSLDPLLVAQLGLLSSVDASSVGGAREPVIGQYQLLERLGSGGMGTVFKARHLRLKKLVALKVLRFDSQHDEHLSARFSREIEAIGQLHHPNIVQAYDAGEAAGISYLAMELVAGRDVETHCRSLGQLPWRSACEIIQQAALGLQHAHERGFLHRDVKPSNLLVSSEGVVKVADLGLARLTRAETGSLTDAGFIVGTPDYISPEQSRGGELDARSDLYSLGCTLYRMLAGVVLFPPPDFDTRAKKMSAHAERSARPLAELRDDLPPGVLSLMDRLLAKDPDQRPASAAALAAELRGLTAGHGLSELTAQISLTEDLPTPASEPELHSTTRPKAGQTVTIASSRARVSKSRWLWTTTAACLLSLAALAAWLLVPRQSLPFDDTQNQADMPLNAWQPILAGHAPIPLAWPQNDPNSTQVFKANEDRLFLSCTGNGLVSFGRMTRGNYRIQLELQQHDWPGGVGFFWGGQELGEGDAKVWHCQALLLSYSTGYSSGAKHFIHRAKLQVPVNPAKSSFVTSELSRQETPHPFGGAKTLELQFMEGRLREVKWDGQSLPELVTMLVDSRSGEHTGQFGVFVDTAACIVSDARVQRVR